VFGFLLVFFKYFKEMSSLNVNYEKMCISFHVSADKPQNFCSFFRGKFSNAPQALSSISDYFITLSVKN